MTTTQREPKGESIRERVLDQIRDYLVTHRGIAPDDIDESTHFRDDLDLDSLDVAALAVYWEDQYGTTVEDERLVTCTTVGKAIDLVEELSRAAA